jgi:hypothetical protein
MVAAFESDSAMGDLYRITPRVCSWPAYSRLQNEPSVSQYYPSRTCSSLNSYENDQVLGEFDQRMSARGQFRCQGFHELR